MADVSTMDLSEDRSGSVRAYTIGITILTLVAVSVRFMGRLLIERGNRFWWDDWAALASVVSPLISITPVKSFNHRPSCSRLFSF
jgi:hypothetical protein